MRTKLRIFEEKLFRVLMFLSTTLIVLTLVVIIVAILYKGLPSTV